MQKAMVDLKKSDIILVNSDFVKTFYNTEIYNKIKLFTWELKTHL